MIKYETQYNAPAMMEGRSGEQVKGIVIHHYGMMGSTYAGTIRALTMHTAAASAHFVIDKDKVAQLVALSDTAYHANNWDVNLTTIGIECPPEATAAQVETLVQLVAGLYAAYGRVLPLTGHKDHAKTQCPGRYYTQLASIQCRATALWQSGAPDLSDVDTVPDWAAAAAEWAIASNLVKGSGSGYGWRQSVTLARLVTILFRFAHSDHTREE